MLTLSAALGVSTTIYGILDSVRHPYTPYADPDRLFFVRPWGDIKLSPLGQRHAAVSDALKNSGTIAGMWDGSAIAEVAGGVQEVTLASVTANYFTVTGLTIVAGRAFDANDPHEVAIVSENLWHKWFSGRRALDGAAVNLDGRVHEVVGVVASESGEDVYVPLAPNAAFVHTILRLKPGATERAARMELDFIAQRLNAEFPQAKPRFSFGMSGATPKPEFYRAFHLILAGTGLIILLIACTNVGNLMLVRGIARRREIALRFALGASRSHVVREMLAEATLVVAVGAVVGQALATWGFYLIRHDIPANIRGGVRLGLPMLNWRVFAFVAVTAAVVAVLTGVLPALRASLVDVNEPLKEQSGTTTGRTRGRYSPFAIGELALAMTLLMAAGLLVRALSHVSMEHFGFESRELATLYVYGGPRDGTALDRATASAAQVPGVLGVAAAYPGVIPGGTVLSDLPGDSLRVWTAQRVSAGFHETMGIAILKGRAFEPGDVGTDIVIVDDSAAARLWPGMDPIGRLLKLGSTRSTAPWSRVVGVAKSVRAYLGDPAERPPPIIYAPVVAASRWFQLVLRVRGNGPAVAAQAARRLQATLGMGSVPGVGWWRAGFEARQANTEFLAGLFGSLGAFALGLSVVGLYGVLAYAVSQRMREFAVRMALGSTTQGLFRLVMHDAAVMTLAGTGIGAFLAMWSAWRLELWLYDVHPTDPFALVSAEAVLVAVAFAACVLPARRAMKADPAEILRAV